MKQIEFLNPLTIIHTAGLNGEEKCENKPELAFLINLEPSSMEANVSKHLGNRL